jgi:hypothetical protein
MKIDKSVGDWVDSSTLIDDIAYSLYLGYYIKEFNKLSETCTYLKSDFKPGSQYFFMLKVRGVTPWYGQTHLDCYKKAELVIKREKILKIKERIYENR